MTTDVQTTPAMPHGEPAPALMLTTPGTGQLEDYVANGWVLFSHPADFTPVCTTEFIAFAKRHADFQALGCELLGTAIDNNFSHIAWERNIKEKFGVEIG
ncbi:redoxin domain-containing protein, partial [Lamprobacter modestohalophilus]|uniref:redoxin domain-containing protein n=1 Tax=Lamprobacter modestohalophilus TaxID=1064514 RepID=UPI002ADEDE8F